MKNPKSIIILVGLVLALLVGFSSYQYHLPAPAVGTEHQVIQSCGTTPREARARGCRFELHNFAWVPPACYDTELAAEWDADDTLHQFSHDAEGLRRISLAEAQRGELEWAWVTWGQHLAHCALIWRKYQRAVTFGWPMDNWTSSYTHTNHCARNMLRWDLVPDLPVFNSKLHLKFPACDYSWRTAITPDELGEHDAMVHHR